MSAITTTTTGQACCPSCAEAGHAATLASACALDPAQLDGRLKEIGGLAARFLRSHERDGLTLRLTYDEDALGEIESLVAREAECCTFLAFDLAHGAGLVRLTITAPSSFSEQANELFAHFAPAGAGAVR